jgi:hypothetical protein
MAVSSRPILFSSHSVGSAKLIIEKPAPAFGGGSRLTIYISERSDPFSHSRESARVNRHPWAEYTTMLSGSAGGIGSSLENSPATVIGRFATIKPTDLVTGFNGCQEPQIS